MYKTEYLIVTALTSFATLFLSAFVYLRGPKKKLNFIYSLWAVCVGLWAFFLVLNILATTQQNALLWCRILHIWAIILPAVYVHFVLLFLGNYEKKKSLVSFLYAASVILIIFDFSPWFLTAVFREKFKFFVSKPLIFYPIHLLFFIGSVFYVYYELIRSLMSTKGAERKKNLYFFIATISAYSGGLSNYLINYDLLIYPMYPYGNLGVLLYVVVIGLVIVRYGFLNIEIIVKRTLVFAGLFSVLMMVVGTVTALTQSYIGQLFGMGRMTSSILSILLTMVLFDPTRKLLINLTDKFLFQKKYDYHKLLKDASRGMSNIESLEHLLGLVVHFVTMKMRVKNAAVLMREGTSDQYQLVYQRGIDKKFLTLTLYQNDPLIHYLETHKEAVDIERIKEQVEAASYKRDQSEKAYDYEAIRERMNQLQASCCVPSFLGRELRNILMLGEKKSGEYYSNEDLNLLYTLAQESSIAIENARLYDEALRKTIELERINEQLERSKTLLIKALQEAEGANKQLQDTQAQLIHEQKMATLGRLAASVGHEVNNPLTILSMNVSRVILKYRKNQDMKVTEILDVFDKMEKNIERIKAVVNTLTGLLKKSEKGKFEPLSLKLILEETLPLVQFQTYLDNLPGTEVEFNVPGNVPLIRGDLERLQEVFLNLFINAYHAMAGKRYRKIGVLAEIDPKDPNMVAIHFKDNGSGMTEEIMKNVFNYGFTTKPPGKGSGLGLYMCKYIIELHGGTITVASKVGEGTTFTLTLPICSETPALKAVPPKRVIG